MIHLRHTTPKATSYQIITDPFAADKEEDQIACVHCRTPWVVRPRSGVKRGWCMKCNGITCGSPRCDVCIPYMDRYDPKYEALRQERDSRPAVDMKVKERLERVHSIVKSFDLKPQIIVP